MPLSRRSFLMTTLAALPTATLAPKTEQNWPEFRGPGGRGIADGYPTRTTSRFRDLSTGGRLQSLN